MVVSIKNRLGWQPDKPDQRDHIFSLPFHWFQTLPSQIDLRLQCPPVMDQGNLGACTANAIAAALMFDAMKQKEAPVVPARLFIYYNERAMENSVASDSGAQIRDGIKSVSRQGACPETEWPYDIGQFAVQPPSQCYTDALQHRALSYQRVPQTLSQMKGCLAGGYPFVLGITVYESFESDQVAQSGIVPMPGHDEAALGGHCVMCCGYDDAQQVFICLNSWGSNWGDKGYFHIPYAYLLSSSLSSDFWTIRSVQ